MAKSKAELELEYQDILKVSQSLIGGINKMIDDTAKSQKGLNKIASKQNDILKSINNNISEYSDLDEAILKVAKQKLTVNERYWGVNKKFRPIINDQLNSQMKLYQTEQLRGVAIGQVDTAAQHLSNTLSSSLDGITSGLGDIPLIGGMLEKLADGPVEQLKSTFSTVAQTFTTEFKSALNGGMKGMDALKVAGSKSFSILTSMINPITIGIIAIGAALAFGVKRFKEIDHAGEQFRKTTGLLNSQTGQTMINIQNISRDMAVVGASAEDVVDVMSSFTNEFDGLNIASKDVIKNMIVLNKNFGISVEDGVKLNKVFQNMAGYTEQGAQALIGQTVQMAKIAGVAPNRVLKDMAESSETAYTYFNGSPKELAKAAVQAAKLGTSIASASRNADNLLDFESSITKELELGAMLGVNMNFSKARQLAYDGKLVDSQQAILDQVSKIGDINKLGVFQKKALVDATGMELSELINQQRIRQKFGKLDSDRLASANALLDTGIDIKNLSKDDLDIQTKKMKNEHEMQGAMDVLSEKTSALTTGFMDMFAPLGKFLIPVLSDIMGLLGDVLLPTFKVIGSLFKIIFGTLKLIWDGVMAIIKPVFALGKAIMEFINEPMNAVGDWFSTFGDTLSHAGESITAFIMAPFEGLMSFLRGIRDYMLNMVPEWVSEFVGGTPSITATQAPDIGTGLTHGGRIDDGIVQNGKIITTSPDDTLIATKTPNSLLGSNESQIITQDNSQLLTKLDEVIKAIDRNKDIYLDKEKVTTIIRKTGEKQSGNPFGLSIA